MWISKFCRHVKSNRKEKDFVGIEFQIKYFLPKILRIFDDRITEFYTNTSTLFKRLFQK